MDGIPVTLIARQFGVSRDSIYRWKNSNLAPALRDALEASDEGVSSLLTRVVGLADDALRTRKVLAASGQHVASIKAGAHELRVLETLLDRLQVDSTDIVDSLRQAFRLMEALRQLADTHPEAIFELGHLLELAGDDDLGPSFKAIVTPPRKDLS